MARGESKYTRDGNTESKRRDIDRERARARKIDRERERLRAHTHAHARTIEQGRECAKVGSIRVIEHCENNCRTHAHTCPV